MITIPDTNNISRIADWIELSIAVENESYSKSRLISVVRETGEELTESKIDSAFNELMRRLKLYGKNKPPFEIDRKVIRPNIDWVEHPEHTLCLYFSTFGVIGPDTGTKLFERISHEVLKFYLDGEAATFGFPNSLTLTQQIHEIAQACCEPKGGLVPASSDKDRGVDVIAWKPFLDDRNSQIIVLLQCAAGGSWRTKKPIPLQHWSTFINWNYLLTIPGMSVTHIIEDNKWVKDVFDYGLIIDRARIYRTLSDPGFKVNTALQTEVKSWCNAKVINA